MHYFHQSQCLLFIIHSAAELEAGCERNVLDWNEHDYK